MYTTFQHNSKHYTYAGGVEALVVRGYITAGQIQFHLVHIELKGCIQSSGIDCLLIEMDVIFCTS